ncbi:hypothetical protein [Arthrobacter sp. zg-Y1116]|uniref:hypothetical protein n=1 Tax=Arthrobacter sp. zg-Y1116 TaxID=2964611 RepID=UPI002104B28A|nr:hypothetical protein [Arthrobacter sp. zg-Y1116]MCQ1947619.1 hypothetical protein [Arthrobacter sp. zg-Y1116]
MAVNRSSAVRTDLPFLSRRVKPRAAAPAAPQAATAPQAAPAPRTPPTPAAAPRTSAPQASAPARPATPAPAPGSLSLSPPPRQQPAPSVSPSLSLGLSPNAEAASSRAAAPAAPRPTSSSRTSEPVRAEPLHNRLFPAPGMGELRSLDRQNPVLRLTPMESAVGSLVVAGTVRAVWEGPGYSTGSISAGEFRPEDLDGVQVQAPGNRPLVGYEDDLALVPLRHVRMLRRALFFAKPKQPMSVGVYNGKSVTIPAQAGHRSYYALSVIRIDDVLELRAEELPYGMEFKAIWEAFGFTMTTRLPYQGR